MNDFFTIQLFYINYLFMQKSESDNFMNTRKVTFYIWILISSFTACIYLSNNIPIINDSKSIRKINSKFIINKPSPLIKKNIAMINSSKTLNEIRNETAEAIAPTIFVQKVSSYL